MAELLESITIVQMHRGPDASGIFYDDNVGMCHTRLSIIDLSEKANQPFRTRDGRFVIVYNGEVYNYPKLRQELASLGHTFETNSDTEVVLKSYIQWGKHAFPRFDGMFAIAIYDRTDSRMIVARDRLGIKPLYFYSDQSKVIVSSEVKAIVAVCDDIRYRRRSIDEILMCGHIEGINTAFEQVYALEPGSWFEVDVPRLEMEVKAYVNLLDLIKPEEYESNRSIPIRDLSKQMEKLIQRSVGMHLLSDTPLGSLCSGGLDSSLITALAWRTNPHIELFHAEFDGIGSEEVYARKVADFLKVNLHTVCMNRELFLGSLVEAIYHLDFPMYHPNDISLLHVCKLAKSQGVKVLLCGEGADELFGGYPWQSAFARNLRIRSFTESRLTMKKVVAFIDKFSRFFRNSDEPLSDYVVSAGVFRPYGYKSEEMMAKNYALIYNSGHNLSRWNSIVEAFSFLPNLSERCGSALMVDNLFGHLGTILHRTDRMGMMASIENRVPFLENNIIEFALNLPLPFKISNGITKKILKLAAEEYLPKVIINRRKAGFPVPWATYLQFNEHFFRDGFVSNHFGIPSTLIQQLTNQDPFLLFRLSCIEIWGRIYVFKQGLDLVRGLVCPDS